VTGIPVSLIFDLYTRLSQILNALVNDLSIRNTIICAYCNKRWRKIFGITRLTSISDDDYSWFRQITATVNCDSA